MGRAAGETRGAGVGVPPAVEMAEEPAEEASKEDDPSAPKKKRVMQWIGSSEPVQSSKATQRQEAQAQPMRQTRRAAAPLRETYQNSFFLSPPVPEHCAAATIFPIPACGVHRR